MQHLRPKKWVINRPLSNAAVNGHLELCKFIIANSQDEKEPSGQPLPPLHGAAWYGYLDVCQFLIENGMDMDLKDQNGTTPLHYAAYYGHSDVCKYLISKSAKINQRNHATYMPIHFAAQEGHFEVCKILLDEMDDKNPRDHIQGWTPFMQAAKNGHLDLCRFFMYGTEEKIKNPIVRILYLVKLIFLFPNLNSTIGFYWPTYFAIICFAWIAPFITEAFYILDFLFSVCPNFGGNYSVTMLLSVSSFMIFSHLLHLYFKKITRNLNI